MPRLQAQVYGTVQGVFFRAFVQETARKLKLVGWTRNCNDGSVEVVAEGSRFVLEAFLEALKKGPVGSAVKRVDANWSKETGGFKTFEIMQ